MTLQEIAEAGKEVFLERLQKLMDDTVEEADKVAGEASKARTAADELLARAAKLDERGLALRHAAEQTRRSILAMRDAPADIQGVIITDDATREFPRLRTPYPLAHHYLTWNDPPHRRCNHCLRVLRPATDDEIQAATTGRDVSDVRAECPDCQLELAGQANTPAALPASTTSRTDTC